MGIKRDMKVRQGQTTDVMIEELGRRLRQYRMGRNWTQQELAVAAGLDRKSVAKIEKGGDVNLSSFVQMLRALGRVDDLDKLMPEQISRLDPFAVLESERNKRRRVRHSKVAESEV